MNTIEYIDRQVEKFMPLIERYKGDESKLRSILIQAISNAVSDTIIEIANDSYAALDESGKPKLRIINTPRHT